MKREEIRDLIVELKDYLEEHISAMNALTTALEEYGKHPMRDIYAMMDSYRVQLIILRAAWDSVFKAYSEFKIFYPTPPYPLSHLETEILSFNKRLKGEK